MREAVTSEKTFVMPDFSTLTTKALQLTALRTVRSQASTSYRELLKEKLKMTTLLRNLNTTQNRGLDLATHVNHGQQQHNPSHGQKNYQQGPSQAENTLQRYNGGGQDNNVGNNFGNNNFHNVETRTHPGTGLQHPYDKERDFLSRFPLGFEGCYNCGQKDHRNTRDCTMAKNGNFDKTHFFQRCGHISHCRSVI